VNFTLSLANQVIKWQKYPMKYDLLLLDADETILDFKKSEDYSLQVVLAKHGIRNDSLVLKESYKKINEELWNDHARGIISKDHLKIERFRLFLKENNLKADPNLMGEDYLKALPEKVFLINGALEFLQTLHGKIPMVIVTNGIGHVQHLRLERSGLRPFITDMIISEVCGYSKPDRRIFDHTFSVLNLDIKNTKTLMIGDRLETDILGAQNAGIDSCWFNPNRDSNNSGIVPTIEVNSLNEILNFL
jgi:2-haloacid dehalogenase